MDSVVVLPAPFGPSRPKNEPAGTSRSTPATASLVSNRLTRPRSDIAGSGSGAAGQSALSLAEPNGR